MSSPKKLQVGNKERAEQIAGGLADVAFQIGNDDLPIVHRMSQVELWRVLGKNVADGR